MYVSKMEYYKIHMYNNIIHKNKNKNTVSN